MSDLSVKQRVLVFGQLFLSLVMLVSFFMFGFFDAHAITCSDYDLSPTGICLTNNCGKQSSPTECVDRPVSSFLFYQNDEYCSGGSVTVDGSNTTSSIHNLYSYGYYTGDNSEGFVPWSSTIYLDGAPGTFSASGSVVDEICDGLGSGEHRWFYLRYNLTGSSGQSLATRVWGEGTIAPPDAPTLFSPELPYSSSSTPIRFTVQSADGGKITCQNDANYWSSTSGDVGTNGYATFSADMVTGDDLFRCTVAKGGMYSDPLEFTLTLLDSGASVPPPVFVEVSPDFEYSVNPARVSLTSEMEGDIWCKKGSGDFVNMDSVTAGGSIYFDLDFLDISDPLEDGTEYYVSCYLEATGGNSATAKQVFTYTTGSACLPGFVAAPGDAGILVNAFRFFYEQSLGAPILGDFLELNCLFYLDFTSNLSDSYPSDIVWDIDVMGSETQLVLPLLSVYEDLKDGADGVTGISDLRTTLTGIFWFLYCVFLFIFLFGGIESSTKE